MKTTIISFAILSLTFIFTSCADDKQVIPSDTISNKTFSFTDFKKIDVSDIFIVQFTFSETEESVVVEANDNLHQLIDISQHGDKLYISLDENTNIIGMPVLNVYIKTALVDYVKAEGASMVDFQNQMLGNRLELEIIGASLFRGAIHVDELEAQLYGAGKMKISGFSNSFEITAEGASEMTDFDFETNILNAHLEGASNLWLRVNQELHVRADGASNVYYKGDGVIAYQNLTGASKIVKMD